MVFHGGAQSCCYNYLVFHNSLGAGVMHRSSMGWLLRCSTKVGSGAPPSTFEATSVLLLISWLVSSPAHGSASLPALLAPSPPLFCSVDLLPRGVSLHIFLDLPRKLQVGGGHTLVLALKRIVVQYLLLLAVGTSA